MDAQAQKKALFRAKLNAQKREKRIESPLVRLVRSAHPNGSSAHSLINFILQAVNKFASRIVCHHTCVVLDSLHN